MHRFSRQALQTPLWQFPPPSQFLPPRLQQILLLHPHVELSENDYCAKSDLSNIQDMNNHFHCMVSRTADEQLSDLADISRTVTNEMMGGGANETQSI